MPWIFDMCLNVYFQVNDDVYFKKWSTIPKRRRFVDVVTEEDVEEEEKKAEGGDEVNTENLQKPYF